MKKQLLALLTFFTLAFSSSAITVVTPNGGEVWLVGQTYKITWTGGGNGMAAITYSYDGGSNWNTITTVVSALGTYNWLVPNTPSTKCLVMVAESSTNFDVSNAMFTILGTSTGIGNVADANAKDVVLFPNPASENLNIVVPSSQVIEQVKIYNMLGSLVKEVRFEQGSALPRATVPVADLSKGQYFAEVRTNAGTVTEKISVVH